MFNNSNKIRGVTLIETIFGIGIMVLVGLAVWEFQRDVFYLNSVMESGLSAESDARKVVKNFAAEIRTASIGNDGSYPILDATNTSISFFSDIDGDGLKEKIRYFTDGNVLKKGIVKPTGTPLAYNSINEVLTTVINNMVNGTTPVFEFYDKNYDGTTNPLSLPVNILNIRLVKIMAMIDENSVRSPSPIKITTQISIRNLKDNL